MPRIAEFTHSPSRQAIGGVPPLGHAQILATYIDQDLLQYAQIWAAAGHPYAVFALTGEELIAMTGGRVAAIASRPQGER